ncbi:hypothetical protein PoB_006509700 [Plakobranchus ocellatus]|uniref:Uncharacterized protein n=1 Tax=Plakobranchus ocellatus TaxID=259542 RepID=A0AAV4D331_9GAST|nr:hypothetical protein PoB_006509700 [Plakobranchus ocellatus]
MDTSLNATFILRLLLLRLLLIIIIIINIVGAVIVTLLCCVGGTVNNEHALRSARTFSSWVRIPQSAAWPGEELESLRSHCYTQKPKQ